MAVTAGLGTRKLEKTLLVASEAPCSSGGAPMVLDNLFKDFPFDRLRIYCARHMYKCALRKGRLLPHEHEVIRLPPHTVRVIGVA
jgi:hypothetical protein